MTRACLAMMMLICGSWSAWGAADSRTLAGHWEADMTEEGRTFTFALELKPSGDILTGSVAISTRDRSFPITDGRIEGNSVSFIGFGKWTGTLRGDELALTRELDGGKKQRMTAHRTPAK